MWFLILLLPVCTAQIALNNFVDITGGFVFVNTTTVASPGSHRLNLDTDAASDNAYISIATFSVSEQLTGFLMPPYQSAPRDATPSLWAEDGTVLPVFKESIGRRRPGDETESSPAVMGMRGSCRAVSDVAFVLPVVVAPTNRVHGNVTISYSSSGGPTQVSVATLDWVYPESPTIVVESPFAVDENGVSWELVSEAPVEGVQHLIVPFLFLEQDVQVVSVETSITTDEGTALSVPVIDSLHWQPACLYCNPTVATGWDDVCVLHNNEGLPIEEEPGEVEEVHMFAQKAAMQFALLYDTAEGNEGKQGLPPPEVQRTNYTNQPKVHCFGDGQQSLTMGPRDTRRFLSSVQDTDDEELAIVAEITIQMLVPVGVTSGHGFRCVWFQSGRTVCWGEPHRDSSSEDNTHVLLQAPRLRYQTLSTSAYTVCGINMEKSSPVCWGSNLDSKMQPPPISTVDCVNMLASANNDERFLSRVGLACSSDAFAYQDIQSGDRHTCAIQTNNAISCWGRSGDRQLGPCGEGTENNASCLAFGGSVRQVRVSSTSTCALWDEGQVSCWGLDSSGALDAPTEGSYRTISSGAYHSCAIAAETGLLSCWGQNDDEEADPPVGVRFRQIAAGFHHTCGVTEVVTESDLDELQEYLGMSLLVCWGSLDVGPCSVDTPLCVTLEPMRGQRDGINIVLMQGEPMEPFLSECLEDPTWQYRVNLTDVADFTCGRSGASGMCTADELENGVCACDTAVFDGRNAGYGKYSCEATSHVRLTETDDAGVYLLSCGPFGYNGYTFRHAPGNGLMTAVFYIMLFVTTMMVLMYEPSVTGIQSTAPRKPNRPRPPTDTTDDLTFV